MQQLPLQQGSPLSTHFHRDHREVEVSKVQEVCRHERVAVIYTTVQCLAIVPSTRLIRATQQW